MQTRTRIGMALGAVALAGGIAFGFLPRAVEVELATAERAPLVVTIEEEGKTRVRDRYVISAPVSGQARRIALRVGDLVQAGQAVAAIEPLRSSALDPRSQAQAAATVRAAEAALAAARANARAAVAQAELARQELDRIESLRAARFVSDQAVDKARTDADRGQAARSAAEHAATAAQFELERARAALAGATRNAGAAEVVEVRTPVGAAVLKVLHESEGPVQAGTALIEVGDPASLEVEVEVLSSQAVKIRPDAKVLFDRWGGEAPLAGRVRVVEPTGYTKISALGVEEQRVRVIADLASPREQWARVGDGYRVEARFVVWEGQDVLQIPSSALFRHDHGWAAFAVDGGRARLQVLEIGQRNGLRVQVNTGLAAGAQVIAHPDDKISDGRRVKQR